MKLTYLLIAAPLVFALGCADKEALKQAKVQQQLLADKTVPVTFVTPKVTTVEATLEVNGPLKSLDEVQLGARVPGRLIMVAVKDGSPVRRGQVIARVETADIMQQIQQAQAAVAVAESARQQAIINARISPQQTAAAIRQARAALSAAKAKLSMTRKGARSQERQQARERVTLAKATLDKRKIDLERAKTLYANDAIAKSEVDAAQWQYDSALADYRSALEALSLVEEGARPEEISQAQDAVQQAEEQLRSAIANSMTDDIRRQQVQQAEGQLRQARASLRLAQMQLVDTAIVSPVDGYVSGKAAQVGQVMSAGTPVATVVSLSGVYLEGQIPEKEMPNVAVGQSAEVRLDAWPGKVFHGSIVAIRPSADSLGRLFAARIAINDSKALRPGMFGKAKILLATIRDAVMVPIDAVLTQNNKAYVYVANGQVAKRIEVRLGKTQNDWVQVMGLAPSQKVILRGKDSVLDGSQIREDKAPQVEASR